MCFSGECPLRKILRCAQNDIFSDLLPQPPVAASLGPDQRIHDGLLVRFLKGIREPGKGLPELPQRLGQGFPIQPADVAPEGGVARGHAGRVHEAGGGEFERFIRSGIHQARGDNVGQVTDFGKKTIMGQRRTLDHAATDGFPEATDLRLGVGETRLHGRLDPVSGTWLEKSVPDPEGRLEVIKLE